MCICGDAQSLGQALTCAAMLGDFSVSDQPAAVRASVSAHGGDPRPDIVTLPRVRKGD